MNGNLIFCGVLWRLVASVTATMAETRNAVTLLYRNIVIVEGCGGRAGSTDNLKAAVTHFWGPI